MTRGKISLGRPWFSRVFPGWAGPEEVDDVAIASIPLGGAGRWNDLRKAGAANVDSDFVNLSKVPEGFQWWVPFCEIYHTDTALTSNGWIYLRDRGTNEVAISGTHSLFNNTKFGILQPMIVPEGWRLGARLRTTTAAGGSIFITAYYVEMPIGEYVAPL